MFSMIIVVLKENKIPLKDYILDDCLAKNSKPTYSSSQHLKKKLKLPHLGFTFYILLLLRASF